MDPLSERCTAQAKRSGQRCQQWVIGGGVCFKHGGKARRVEARRQVRILTGRAALAGQPVEQRDPGEALVAAAADADSMLQRLKSRLATGELTGTELTAFGEWIDRTSRIAKTVLDARIDERRARLTEQQGQLLYAGLDQFVRTLPADLHAGARRQIAQMLRALGRGEVPGERPAIEAGQ